MAIRVLELHHHAIRAGDDEAQAAKVRAFYSDVLGLGSDSGRPTIAGVPGSWINVGEVGQIHLIAGAQPSPIAKAADKDPTVPHVALAVADIVETKAELDRMGVRYWSMTGVAGPEFEQLFLYDPQGNMVELHQIDKCRCRAPARR
jgi:catechol 2,3-dioxygenase-like lactoylglutathione lyase family enzyme